MYIYIYIYVYIIYTLVLLVHMCKYIYIYIYILYTLYIQYDMYHTFIYISYLICIDICNTIIVHYRQTFTQNSGYTDSFLLFTVESSKKCVISAIPGQGQAHSGTAAAPNANRGTNLLDLADLSESTKVCHRHIQNTAEWRLVASTCQRHSCTLTHFNFNHIRGFNGSYFLKSRVST